MIKYTLEKEQYPLYLMITVAV